MKKIVVFTGAGMSADSGISTFRDSDGLWERFRIEDVCTPEALRNNREQVIKFYNMRRKELLEARPNAGHLSLVDLTKAYNVDIVTQNIDDLHERAAKEKGVSMNISHLHGELRKLCSSYDVDKTVDLDGWEQKIDERHPDGSLLRPFVVFFGESVPMLSKAIQISNTADILIIIGTSLAVYPAASLIHHINSNVPIYVVDPGEPAFGGVRNRVIHINERGETGVPQLVNSLLSEAQDH